MEGTFNYAYIDTHRILQVIKLIINKQKLQYCSYPIEVLVAVLLLFEYFL